MGKTSHDRGWEFSCLPGDDEGAGTSGTFIARDGSREVWHLERSGRARRVTMRFGATDGITIVAPRRARIDPASVLEEHRGWIERAMVRLGPQREAYLASAASPLPRRLELLGIGETWDIELRRTGASGITSRTSKVRGSEGTLTIAGDVADRDGVEAALRRFVFRRAKEKLPGMLSEVADRLGIAYSGCRVANARSRWGSCSSKGVIMLSSHDVFLPPELLFHVMCHELAHTVHLDHSAAFHELLSSFDEDGRAHAASLMRASRYVPAWMQGKKRGT